jgi:peptidoglycan/LPS O-acetylase OafA/YrhL
MSLSGTARTHVTYRAAIDGLRGVAILGVFIFHLNRQWLPGGFVGVDVFFVISGYLITSVLLKDLEDRTLTLRTFYQRRIARLYPAFFVTSMATLIGASLVYSPQDLASTGASLTAASLCVANMKFMWQGNYFTRSPDAQPFLHYWSLSVEEQFYLIFPLAFLFLFLTARRSLRKIMGVACGASLAGCIALTWIKPEWAFFLLPTRAWELLAGSLLVNPSTRTSPQVRGDTRLGLLGLTLIAVSMLVINETAPFPGWLAVLPVAGTMCCLGWAGNQRGLSERLLSTRPMVLIGRMSYSLYLWHWPVFSLVDYKFYTAPPFSRVGLKLALTAAATAVCFFFVERPGRAFLNNPRRAPIAFAFVTCGLLFSVPLGTVVRTANYLNADVREVSHGGIVFNGSSKKGSIMLMGDSNASMYGKTLKEIAGKRGLKLDIISVAAGDPLPFSSGQPPRLWLDSLSMVKREHPAFLVLVCHWRSKLELDRQRLQIAINELKPLTGHLILITQPPELPAVASRESMRHGSKPPFLEDPAERAVRSDVNAFLKSFEADRVSVIDIESEFTTTGGTIFITNQDGRLLYDDQAHLSGVGADRVKSHIIEVIDQDTRIH